MGYELWTMYYVHVHLITCCAAITNSQARATGYTDMADSGERPVSNGWIKMEMFGL